MGSDEAVIDGVAMLKTESSERAANLAHPAKGTVQVIYGLYLGALIVGITSIVGVIMAYVKRGELRGTWLESHMSYLIRTFWWSMLWSVIGLITIFIVIGYFVLLGNLIWYVYRSVKGLMAVNEGKPIA